MSSDTFISLSSSKLYVKSPYITFCQLYLTFYCYYVKYVRQYM